MKENVVVLDVETQKGFQDVGRDKHHRLKISVAGIYCYAADEYLIFEEKDILRLEPIVRNASLVIGFNILHFDFPVLAPYFFSPLDHLPALDLLLEIEKIRGHRVTLESVSEATLKKSKSGSGKDAIELFRQGKIAELARYCLDDVRITKEIYEYGKRNGKVYFRSNRDFRVHEIPVSWASFQPETQPTESNFPTSLF